MKTHKIRGIEKTTCTAEQMIAYNIAFRTLSYGRRLLRDYMPDFCRDEMLKTIRRELDTIPERFSRMNKDAIFCAFNAGIMDYLKADNSGICWSYEDVGKSFPLLYPIE